VKAVISSGVTWCGLDTGESASLTRAGGLLRCQLEFADLVGQ